MVYTQQSRAVSEVGFVSHIGPRRVRPENNYSRVDIEELLGDLVVVNTGPENDDWAVNTGDRRWREDPKVVTVEALVDLVWIIVEDSGLCVNQI